MLETFKQPTPTTAAQALPLASILLLLLGCLSDRIAAADGERLFSQVNSSQINCASLDRVRSQAIESCQAYDCFIAEAGEGQDYTKLHHQEWVSMSQAMQELATEDRLEDQYPDGMHVMPPMTELRQRLCPVKYEVLVYRDTVPMLIVHARCINNSTDATATRGRLQCREVQQYRQVYRRLSECKTKDKGEMVYVKSFVNVSVNCAAYND